MTGNGQRASGEALARNDLAAHQGTRSRSEAKVAQARDCPTRLCVCADARLAPMSCIADAIEQLLRDLDRKANKGRAA